MWHIQSYKIPTVLKFPFNNCEFEGLLFHDHPSTFDHCLRIGNLHYGLQLVTELYKFYSSKFSNHLSSVTQIGQL